MFHFKTILWGTLLLPFALSAAPKEFVFSLPSEPDDIDPATVRGVSGSLVYSNLYRGLFRYDTEKGLIPEGANSCSWTSPLLYRCELNPKVKWSSGEPVRAEDYRRAILHVFSPSARSTNAEHMLALENADAILKGEMPPENLGVKTEGDHVITFHLKEPDSDFPYRFLQPAFAPRPARVKYAREKASEIPTTGPYKIGEWQANKHILLQSNPHYFRGGRRPSVRILFVEDDATVTRLFQTKRLNFIRRLTTDLIPEYQKLPGFFQVPLARFDYLGFGPELRDRPELRRALIHSLMFEELRKLYHGLGRPGCPSLPRRLMDTVPCFDFNLDQAKQALQADGEKKKRPGLKITYSMLGGDDIKKGMEWLQHQWKVHLGLGFELDPREQGMFNQDLKTKPPAVFRRGITLDRPTCLAALELFVTDSPNNPIGVRNPAFDRLVKKLRSESSDAEKRSLCRQGVQLLLDSQLMIPLGEIHYSFFHDRKFEGFRLNELHQLDLTDLRTRP